MKINATTHIEKPAEDVFRIVSDLGYWVSKVDPDVRSMDKTSDGPPGVGSTWKEVLKVPGQVIDVDVRITSADPGRSLDVEFTNRAMNGTAKFTVASSGEGSDLSVALHATTRPLMGWLMYPMIRMDLAKREKRRLAKFKEMAESGELSPEGAESPAATV